MKAIAATLLLVPAAVFAWMPDPVPATNWIALFEAVAERNEATWFGEQVYYGSTNQRYAADPLQTAPRVYTQPVKINLGLATGPVVTIFGLEPAVQCQTNDTEVICWTNYVSLDTDYKLRSNLWTWAYPFGPQYATNLVWRKGDPRLSPFDHLLPNAITVTPTRAAIRDLDTDIYSLIEFFVDIDRMRRVPGGANLTGTNLIALWFATPAGTNWHWIETEPDSGDWRWVPETNYPKTLPMLTASSAWYNAGIEPWRWPVEVVTNCRPVYGWEVGQYAVHTVGTSCDVATNWAEIYTFEVAPTATPWVVTLGRLYWAITNTVYAPGGLVREQIGPLRVDGGGDAAMLQAPRMLGMQFGVTNEVRFTPPGTNEYWPDLFEFDPGWGVHIGGQSFVWLTNRWEPSESITSRIDYVNLQWTSGLASLELSEELNGGLAWLRSITELYATNWPLTENVWSNGVLIMSNGHFIGATLDVTLRGTRYEQAPGYPWQSPYLAPTIFDMTMRDWSQRWAIVRQMQWMREEAPSGKLKRGAARGWYPYYTYDPYHEMEYCEPPVHSPYNSATTMPFSVYAWQPVLWAFCYRQIVGWNEHGAANDWSNVASATVYTRWTDRADYAVTNLSPRLEADISLAGRWHRVLPPHFDPHPYPMTVTNSVVYWNSSLERVTQSITRVQASDPLGPDQYWPLVAGEFPKSASETWSPITGVDWSGGRGPSGWIPLRFDFDYPDIHPYWAGSHSTEFHWPLKDRMLSDEQVVIRWRFRHWPD